MYVNLWRESPLYENPEIFIEDILRGESFEVYSDRSSETLHNTPHLKDATLLSDTTLSLYNIIHKAEA
jgi:hypothetical protein